MSGKHKLYAVPTWGSAIVELALEHGSLPFEIEYLSADDVRSADYKKINPLSQIPSLVLPNGETMTESLAIAMYVNEKGRAGLIPSPDSPEYAQFLRWSVFLASSIYSIAPYNDHPDWFVREKSAQTELREESMKRIKERFLLMENECRSPWFLGEKKSLIDLNLAVMSFWDPGQAWFEKNCPRIMENVRRLKDTKEFQAVFRRNDPEKVQEAGLS